uniref:Late embryogenesis abundant protein LEA-2 subgroup domain-containing protein n=1 Tax=Leersia perrieri TaxID=77586 RepID=A0A0D9VQK9_9ORYZ
MAERPASPDPTAAFGSPLVPVSSSAVVPASSATRLHQQPPDTYVVHVQKDQIYRVPPPENAYLVERYRTNGGKGGGGGSSSATCSPCVLRTLAAVLAATLLLAAAATLTTVVLRPDAPVFVVDKLSVHNATTSRDENRTVYEFFLTAINPNKVTALWYGSGGGTARLMAHGGEAVAKGDVGEPEDGGEDATDFTVLLHGLQRGGEKALRRPGSSRDAAVELELDVDVAVQVHVGALGFARRRLAVTCRITAAGLRRDVHISSQTCKSRFGN